MKRNSGASWLLVLLLALGGALIAPAQEEEEGDEAIVRAQSALTSELKQLEKLAGELKAEASKKTLGEISGVNDELQRLAKHLRNLFHEKGETAGEQAGKDFFSECTGLGRRIAVALEEEGKLPVVQEAIGGVLGKGRDLAVFEPND